MTFPYCNQADLFTNGPRARRERRHWDDDGYERTERCVGATECPRCHLWWPAIEQPDEWSQNAETGRWDAIGWWGGEVCEQCELLLIEQPDGTPECYDLRW